MQTNVVERGCFGSAIFWSATAPECRGCPASDRCATISKATRNAVIGTAETLSASLSSTPVLDLPKRFAEADAAPKVDDKRNKRIAEVLTRWKIAGVNPFLLLHRQVPSYADSVDEVVFRAIKDGRTLRVGDVVEYAMKSPENFKKMKITETAKSVFEALCELKIAKEIKRGLYQI